MKKKWMSSLFGVYFILYALYSYTTLTKFPYIHSDEPWLAGLSKNYVDHTSSFVTEPFFDLFPRNAHAIKSLFHWLQGLFISIFGYNLTTVRLLSFLFGLFSLLLLFLIAQRLLKDFPYITLVFVIAFSLLEQFLYASHFGRQEILLFTILLLCYLLYLYNKKTIIPILIGLSIGFHPNAFILALMIGILYLRDFSTSSRLQLPTSKPLRSLLTFISILSFFALLYIGISFLGNPNFISDYATYGSTLGVDANGYVRLLNFRDFYLKLYLQISGTYYLPNLRLFFIGAGLLFVFSVYICIKKKRLIDGVLMFVAFQIGILIIGRYNPTSILFLFFPVFLLGIDVLSFFLLHFRNKDFFILNFHFQLRHIFLILLLFIVIFRFYSLYTIWNVYQYNDYITYEKEIKSTLEEDSIILGNLSSGFAFENHTFYDIRNLSYLKEGELYMYLKSRDINTVIYYEEYDYIHRNPEWNILYGDESVYYFELVNILNLYGQKIHQFSPRIYGTRIVRYMNDYPFSITIYRLDLP